MAGRRAGLSFSTVPTRPSAEVRCGYGHGPWRTGQACLGGVEVSAKRQQPMCLCCWRWRGSRPQARETTSCCSSGWDTRHTAHSLARTLHRQPSKGGGGNVCDLREAWLFVGRDYIERRHKLDTNHVLGDRLGCCCCVLLWHLAMWHLSTRHVAWSDANRIHGESLIMTVWIGTSWKVCLGIWLMHHFGLAGLWLVSRWWNLRCVCVASCWRHFPLSVVSGTGSIILVLILGCDWITPFVA